MTDIKILKGILGKVAEVIEAVKSAKEDDGKISKMEALGIGLLTPSFFPLFAQFEKLKAELADIDANERDQLTLHFSILFDLTSDVAEAKWEAVFELLASFGVAYKKFVNAGSPVLA